jgi:hypothetical protein
MCEIIEIETFIEQFVLVDVYFTFGRNKFRQYSPVLAEDVIYISDVVGSFAVQLVVIIIPAHIGTEFFISPSGDGLSAIETKFFHDK